MLAKVHPDEAIYSAGVSIFRAPESQGHVFLEHPFTVSVVSCPGLYRPQLDASGKTASRHIQQLECKLDLVLKLAACFGHDSVVLGPMGCGGNYIECLPCTDACNHNTMCVMQRGRTILRR